MLLWQMRKRWCHRWQIEPRPEPSALALAVLNCTRRNAFAVSSCQLPECQWHEDASPQVIMSLMGTPADEFPTHFTKVFCEAI